MSATLAALDRSETPDVTLLNIYAMFAEHSGAMLESAQRGDWDDVVRREKACSQLIDRLRHPTALKPADEDGRQECMHLVRKVLADDAAIRDIAHSWLRELDQTLRPLSGRHPARSFR
jgi:flagellar protein FliT